MSPYHHGDLRRTLLAEAAALIAERGPAAVSLRDLARRAGVSHAAPAHHFGDKTGLFTALAAEGHDLLAAALREPPATGLRDLGARYVAFAIGHPSHFAIMFRDDLLAAGDPELEAARKRSYAPLRDAVPDEDALLAAWSLAHGYATLVLAGAAAAPGAAARFPAIAAAAAVLGDGP
ncbi:transcriptional regulator BetI [Actinomadura rubteroloni]|uniref:Transcriptional regulator BetI n=1 Tax=Actinomadura rubteroloni TaxID=1926885 RepID=A0A2P4UDK5_9ACTN|nr:TetR/AcrR family transcriptional regulator [Actinomadura rubteroloni]POM23125.1 transcriptional regulator BetI [Actinomadura rubteroloni]